MKNDATMVCEFFFLLNSTCDLMWKFPIFFCRHEFKTGTILNFPCSHIPLKMNSKIADDDYAENGAELQ